MLVILLRGKASHVFTAIRQLNGRATLRELISKEGSVAKKLSITEKDAISECKKLWEEIRLSGLSKYKFLGSPAGKVWVDKHYKNDCPLCEYQETKSENIITTCQFCPLVTKYDRFCGILGFNIFWGTATDQWYEAVKGL